MAKCARLYLPETLEISSFAVIPKKYSEILGKRVFRYYLGLSVGGRAKERGELWRICRLGEERVWGRLGREEKTRTSSIDCSGRTG